MNPMTQGEFVNAIVNGFVAFGTLLLAALVIYGDRLRSWLIGPKLKLILEFPGGSMLDPTKILYQLTVDNKRKSAAATNCQVRIRRVLRRMPNGDFVDVRLPYPLALSWPPSEYTPLTITVLRDERIDFGFLQKGKFFMPSARVYPTPMIDQLQVPAGGASRYGIEIVSDRFATSTLQMFEVSWNGEWSEDSNAMLQNLKIREVAL